MTSDELITSNSTHIIKLIGAHMLGLHHDNVINSMSNSVDGCVTFSQGVKFDSDKQYVRFTFHVTRFRLNNIEYNCSIIAAEYRDEDNNTPTNPTASWGDFGVHMCALS